jgi:hypothetical protein
VAEPCPTVLSVGSVGSYTPKATLVVDETEHVPLTDAVTSREPVPVAAMAAAEVSNTANTIAIPINFFILPSIVLNFIPKMLVLLMLKNNFILAILMPEISKIFFM